MAPACGQIQKWVDRSLDCTCEQMNLLETHTNPLGTAITISSLLRARLRDVRSIKIEFAIATIGHSDLDRVGIYYVLNIRSRIVYTFKRASCMGHTFTREPLRASELRAHASNPSPKVPAPRLGQDLRGVEPEAPDLHLKRRGELGQPVRLRDAAELELALLHERRWAYT